VEVLLGVGLRDGWVRARDALSHKRRLVNICTCYGMRIAGGVVNTSRHFWPPFWWGIMAGDCGWGLADGVVSIGYWVLSYGYAVRGLGYRVLSMGY
jgi:hypothetical protein